MPREKIKLESMRQLCDYLYESPFLRFRMRLGQSFCTGRVTFLQRQGLLLTFLDEQNRKLMLNFRPDPRGHEWGLRFFPGGFRFRAYQSVTTFYFQSPDPNPHSH